jgi:Protein of unknown function (DUF2442)
MSSQIQEMSMPGASASGIEVTNISKHGFWLLTPSGEHFLPFKDFPWFRDAPVAQILNVEEPSPGHCYWPDLDVDLSLQIIRTPERFPLAAKVS